MWERTLWKVPEEYIEPEEELQFFYIKACEKKGRIFVDEYIKMCDQENYARLDHLTDAFQQLTNLDYPSTYLYFEQNIFPFIIPLWRAPSKYKYFGRHENVIVTYYAFFEMIQEDQYLIENEEIEGETYAFNFN